MQYVTPGRMLLLASLAILAGCHGSQPTIQPTNATTDAQLSTINAATGNTDGMDQGNALLMPAPSPGQRMDAAQQPPKQ